MWIDVLIILAYFVIIMIVGIMARVKKDVGTEEYFLSSRSLGWPSIAISTIATNIHANHFIAMAGSAYLYGLAQANLEINAIFGILMAAFIFIPIYLRMKVMTITQFFEAKLGPRVALTYSVLMIVLYAFMYLGTALFWAAYAIDGVFGDYISFLGSERITRIIVLILITGSFSAIYTYLGGLRAVVRTDIVQFSLLVFGGFITLSFAIIHLGGFENLWKVTGNLMHLHLPSDHEKLPWVAIFGMLLLNLNYWGANQVILQRALAAKSLRDAQIGLIVGGSLKYVIALIIIIPGIALAGILKDRPLSDPDLTYITILKEFIPVGLRGLILTGLFASLMSTLDSIYNSVSTLWSIDIYKRHLRPQASELQVVKIGKLSIFASLITGVAFSLIVAFVKFENPTFALTHWFNDLSYFVKNGFVLLIVSAVFLYKPSRNLVFYILILTVPFTYYLKSSYPEMNYFIRSTCIIILSISAVAIPTFIKNTKNFINTDLLTISNRNAANLGIALGASLIASHVIFH